MVASSAIAYRDDSTPGGSREELRQLIARLSVRKDGSFKLASGRTSDIFFDMKKTMLDATGARLLADEIFSIIDREGASYVGGLVMGAVPIVAQVCLRSSETDRKLQGFFVRKEAKDHGTQELIDGHLEPGASVIMLDDVTTTGGSVMKAIAEVHKRGCNVRKVVTIVDREEGARENLAAKGIELEAIFKKSDFL